MKQTSMPERLSQQLKRRTRIVRIFPSSQSCLRLVRALAAYRRAGRLDEYDRDWVRRWHLRSGLPSQIARMGWGDEIYQVDAQPR